MAKRAYFDLSYGQLLDMLDVPSDTRIVEISVGAAPQFCERLRIYYEHPALPDVPEGNDLESHPPIHWHVGEGIKISRFAGFEGIAQPEHWKGM